MAVSPFLPGLGRAALRFRAAGAAPLTWDSGHPPERPPGLHGADALTAEVAEHRLSGGVGALAHGLTRALRQPGDLGAVVKLDLGEQKPARLHVTLCLVVRPCRAKALKHEAHARSDGTVRPEIKTDTVRGLPPSDLVGRDTPAGAKRGGSGGRHGVVSGGGGLDCPFNVPILEDFLGTVKGFRQESLIFFSRRARLMPKSRFGASA